MATSLLNLLKQQYGQHPLRTADCQQALVVLFTTRFHGPRRFNRVMGDVRQSPRFKQAQQKSFRGVFTAEEAVTLVVGLGTSIRGHQKLITRAQENSKAAEKILGGGWISPFWSYRAMHNAWKHLWKYQKLSVVTHGVYVGVEWNVDSFPKYKATQPDIIDGLHLEKEKPSLTLIVRGDGLRCGSRPWCQLVVGFAELEELTRSIGCNWTVNIALCGKSQEVVLGNLFAENFRYLQWIHDHQSIKVQGHWVDCTLKTGGD